MKEAWIFILGSILFGAGLAMDAFSVSLANGLYDPHMKRRRMLQIAGTFGFFQTLMPLLGWFFVHSVAESFRSVQRYIPWIALCLLLYIGGKMLIGGIRERSAPEAPPHEALRGSALFIQGIATSIDALSVGFAIANYTGPEALAASLIIGAVTFLICAAGLRLGRLLGSRFSGWASIAGGVILIFIGIEIAVTSAL